MSEEHNNNRTQQSNGLGSLVLRLILSAIVLSIASFLTPGFSIRGIWAVLLAAAVISVIDYLLQKTINLDASPLGRGITGFIVSAIVLYIAQFLVPNMGVTVIGAILGALAIGIIDVIVPGNTF